MLKDGANGLAVAQGTHIGIVTGEFGGSAITAIALPETSGTGVPKIDDWVTCDIPGGFLLGFDPHTVTAYRSPNGARSAVAVLANGGATQLAVVDLTKMLSKMALPRTTAGHACKAGTLPASIVSFKAVP